MSAVVPSQMVKWTQMILQDIETSKHQNFVYLLLEHNTTDLYDFSTVKILFLQPVFVKIISPGCWAWNNQIW